MLREQLRELHPTRVKPPSEKAVALFRKCVDIKVETSAILFARLTSLPEWVGGLGKQRGFQDTYMFRVEYFKIIVPYSGST